MIPHTQHQIDEICRANQMPTYTQMHQALKLIRQLTTSDATIKKVLTANALADHIVSRYVIMGHQQPAPVK